VANSADHTARGDVDPEGSATADDTDPDPDMDMWSRFRGSPRARRPGASALGDQAGRAVGVERGVRHTGLETTLFGEAGA